MAEHFRSIGKEVEAKEYDARYSKKLEKIRQLLSINPDLLTPEGKRIHYYQEKVRAQYPNFEDYLKEDKKEDKVKSDGKKSKR